MTIGDALRISIDDGLARIDAQLLMLHALGKTSLDRAWLISHGSDELDGTAATRFTSFAARRLDHEPVAYILGRKAFFGLDLHIDANVLDPRDDTETLVEWALTLPLDRHARVLDMGTGSGAIALALASKRPHWLVHATDASAAALAVAQGNSQRLGLPVKFHHGDWWQAIDASSAADTAAAHCSPHATLPAFDLIVSNPPYIAEGDSHLAQLHHEPAMALASGSDGMDAIHTIVQGACQHLRPGGWLLLEHGHDQSGAVSQLLLAQGFANVVSRKDLANVFRCTGGSSEIVSRHAKAQ